MKLRWRLAYAMDRLPGQCWANLVSWALDGRGARRAGRRLPWAPQDDICRLDASENEACYCGKIRRTSTAQLVAGRDRPRP